MANSLSDSYLQTILPEWHLLLQGWSADGRLTAAAQEALLLDGEPQALTDLITQWSAEEFARLPPIVLLSAADINGAMGAYAISTGTIYLNSDWLAGATKEQVLAVLTEELGHHLDGLLNASDTAGDEGEYFAKTIIRDGNLSASDKDAIANEDDSIAINVNGVSIEGEALSSYGAYGTQDSGSGSRLAFIFDGVWVRAGEPLTYSITINGYNYFADFYNSSNSFSREEVANRFLSQVSSSSEWVASISGTTVYLEPTNPLTILSGTSYTTSSFNGYGLYTKPVVDIRQDTGDATFSISGAENPASPAVDETLIAAISSNDSDGNGIFNYAWQISTNGTTWITVGNNSSYKIADADEGKQIQLIVNYTDAQGFSESVNTPAGTIFAQNEAPIDLIFTSNGINENSAAGTLIGTLGATDPDSGDTFTYELIAGTGGNDADNALVEIIGNEVKVKSGASIDFETNPVLNLNIKVTDNGGLTYTKAVTAAVLNVNEAPTDLTLTSNGINENSAAGTLIGTLGATDPDSGDTFTYELIAGTGGNDADNALVEIIGNEVKVKSGASIDFETNPVLNLNILVKDNGAPALTYAKAFTVDVVDKIETGLLTKDDATVYISGTSGPTGSSKIESVSIVRTVTGTGKKRITTETPSYTTLATYSNPGVDGITFNGGASANTIRAAGVSGDPSRPAFNGQTILDGKLGTDIITGGSYRNWLVGGGIFSTPLSTTTNAVDTLIGTAGALDVFDLRTSDFTADAYSALNTGSARINNYSIDQDWIVLAGTQGSYSFTPVQTTTGSKRNKITTTTGYQILSGTEIVASVTAATGTTLTGNAANDLKILYGQTGDPTQTLLGGQQMFFG